MTVVRVIDFETSGLEPPEAEVCEVGLCDVDLNRRDVRPESSWLCRVRTMPPQVRAVHHISLAECADEEPFDPDRIAALPTRLAERPTVMAAHNSAFECKFFTPSLPVICTYKAALRVWPDAPAHGNNALRYWLEDQGKLHLHHSWTLPTHRAGPDAYVTAHLLLALTRAGATVEDMIQWTAEFRVLPRCPIGKFRGQLWADVDTGFLCWMRSKPDMEPDLAWNAQRELDRRNAE